MSTEPSQETAELMTRFLLGDLSEAERQVVEERFLADEEYFAQLLMMEGTLVDDYVSGRLTTQEQAKAELLFGSSAVGRREQKFTEGLIAALQKAREETELGRERKKKRGVVTDQNVRHKTFPRRQSSWSLIASGLKGLPGILTATAGLIVLLFVGLSIYFIFQYQRQTRELLARQANLERSTQLARRQLDEEARKTAELGKRLELETELRIQAEEALARSRSQESRSIISAVLLPTAFERGGGSKTITLNEASSRIQLLLDVSSHPPYPRYNVLIKTFDGRKIWGRDSIPATQIKQNKLSLMLSASLFPYDDYRVELHGMSEDGAQQLVADYSFKVRK